MKQGEILPFALAPVSVKGYYLPSGHHKKHKIDNLLNQMIG
jgi:hypothetical protein